MQTGHEIVREFITVNSIDIAHFIEWFCDCGCPEEEAKATTLVTYSMIT
jgi:hypothetical protein